jgi:hypothetical protein
MIGRLIRWAGRVLFGRSREVVGWTENPGSQPAPLLTPEGEGMIRRPNRSAEPEVGSPPLAGSARARLLRAKTRS